MDLLDITHDDGAGDDIPDIDHVEIMFEAYKDTVAGNESLTEAQIYAAGVLSASGYRPSVAGNEGFFDSVAGGAKTVYDYIVRMFKSVWSFFFNRDAARQADEAKKEAKEIEGELHTLSSGSASEEVTDKALHSVKAKAAHLQDIPTHDRASFDQFMTQAETAVKSGSVSDKKKAVANLLAAMPKVNISAQEKFRSAATILMNLNKKFVSLVMGANTEIKVGTDAEVKNLAVSIVSDVAKYVPRAIKSAADLEHHDKVATVSDATTLHHQIQTDIEANKQLVNSLKAHTGKLNQEIHFYESLQSEDVRGKHTSTHLEILHGILSFSTAIAQYLKRSMDAQLKLAKSVNAVFGV